jgi:hypothetical protein
LNNYVSSNAVCNGGIGRNRAGTADNLISKRIYARPSVTTGINFTVGTGDAFSWHEDLLMASFFHPQWGSTTAITDGTKWCSNFRSELNVDGTSLEVQATNGFNGKSKCTWSLLMVDGSSKGPTFKLNSASWINFLFHWVEWINIAGLGSFGVLSSTEVADFYLGPYAVTDGVFLSPLKAKVTGSGFEAS